MSNPREEQKIKELTELGTAHFNAGNPEEGIRIWRQTADLGDLRAKYNLGVVEREAGNYEAAAQLWLEPAAAGNVDAQFNLGLVYSRLNESELAEEWFGKAEAAGDPQAKIMLAIIRGEDTSGPEFDQFRETENDDSGAVEEAEDHEALLEKIEAGDMDAANELGTIMGRDGFFEEAMLYHRMAAESGNIEAQGNLGVDYYRQGQIEPAIEWYTKAAEAGSALAQNNLGTLYMAEGKNDLAKPWLQMGIQSGNLNSTMNMAQILSAEGDLNGAIDLLEPLADGGISDARNDIAMAYVRLGYPEKAKGYWTAAAQQGNANSMVNLGILFYEDGQPEMAMSWLKLADSFGHPAAKDVMQSFSE